MLSGSSLEGERCRGLVRFGDGDRRGVRFGEPGPAGFRRAGLGLRARGEGRCVAGFVRTPDALAAGPVLAGDLRGPGPARGEEPKQSDMCERAQRNVFRARIVHTSV